MLFVGDVHGRIRQYVNLVKDHPQSICVGDVCSSGYLGLEVLDSDQHKIVAGNHETYDSLTPHFLGDYGIWNGIFFYRGAYSIDRYVRNVWDQEEVSYEEACRAIELYSTVLPQIVVTHECPSVIKERIIRQKPHDRTSCVLQMMFEIHKPTLWVFGHHHRSLDLEVDGTNFRCLNELETLELNCSLMI